MNRPTPGTADELRELIREGNGLLKDLTRANREAREVIREGRALADHAVAGLDSAVHDSIRQHRATLSGKLTEIARESVSALGAEIESDIAKLGHRLEKTVSKQAISAIKQGVTRLPDPDPVRVTELVGQHFPKSDQIDAEYAGRKVAGCRPVTIKGIPADQVKLFPVHGITDMRRKCGACKRGVWVPAKKLQAFNSRIVTDLLCYPCLMRLRDAAEAGKDAAMHAFGQFAEQLIPHLAVLEGSKDDDK